MKQAKLQLARYASWPSLRSVAFNRVDWCMRANGLYVYLPFRLIRRRDCASRWKTPAGNEKWDKGLFLSQAALTSDERYCCLFLQDDKDKNICALNSFYYHDDTYLMKKSFQYNEIFLKFLPDFPFQQFFNFSRTFHTCIKSKS